MSSATSSRYVWRMAVSERSAALPGGNQIWMFVPWSAINSIDFV